MVRSTFAGAAVVALIVGLTACDGDGRALTAPGLEKSSAGDRLVGPVPELPAISVVEGFDELEISVRLRSVGVPFPGPDEIGVCHTQVSKRQRPVPFEIGRLELDVPEAARDEAAGRSLLVEYRLRARNGLLLEAARCRVPRSTLAVEHVFAQFSKGDRSRESAPVSAASSAGETGSADGWTIRIGPG